MAREIGSEFWDVPQSEADSALFPDTAQWYLSGRYAEKAVIRELCGVRTVAMPSWCCESMIQPFAGAGITVRFYPVYFRQGLRQEIRTDCDALFLMDYFGYTGAAPDLSGYHGVVIRDLTHSLLSRSYADADYYFGSLRKWCGVLTGGYAWGSGIRPAASGDARYAALRKAAMEEKRRFIDQGETGPKDYLAQYAHAEERLEQEGIFQGDPRDAAAAKKLDADFIRARRRKNACVLMDALPDMLMFPSLQQEDTPMFVPVLVPDGKRDQLRRALISQAIYCPIHWPESPLHRLDDRERFIYQNELSLVCDQRYDETDMQRTVDAIRRFLAEA